VPAVPFEASLDAIDHVRGLAEAVAFAGVADHHRLDPDVVKLEQGTHDLDVSGVHSVVS
jgi:hypothetical protein